MIKDNRVAVVGLGYTRWFNNLIKEARFRVEATHLDDSKDWMLVDGVIQHKSGGFFRLVGVEWVDSKNKTHTQPLIEQREIGTLGFLMRLKNTVPELFIQAKIEPGNVGIVQFAPTCQATASNAKQIHGGAKPPYLDWFNDDKQLMLYDVLQSEQGMRFLGKLNRNVLRLIDDAVPKLISHKWLPVERVLRLLAVDFLINSDARSVLVCSPWEKLVRRSPFSKSNSQFAKDLACSYTTVASHNNLNTLRAKLKRTRALTNRPKIIELQGLKNWKLNQDKNITLKGRSFSIRHVHVSAHGREVPTWDQPLVDSSGTGQVDLLCGRINGVLHFLFRPYCEPGLYNYVELGPTVVIEPGKKTNSSLANQPTAVVRIESKQSDEGGRFYKDVNHYRIIDIGEVPSQRKKSSGYWLTLAQIRQLLNEQGWFTNEARGVLSLLLTWL